MKSTTFLLLMGLAVSTGLSAQAGAHGGSRVYPISEIKDSMLAKIELDGLIHEWEDFGEPTMTLTLDFRTYEYSRSPDVSDLDFRIWLGWHDASDRLYLAFVSADDVYFNNYEYHEDRHTPSMRNSDGIFLFVDGDHSGGEGAENSSTDYEWQEIVGRTQGYGAVARSIGAPNLDESSVRYFSGRLAYTIFPPYGDAAGSVIGENPVVSAVEMYVSPYDRWENGWDSRPEQIQFSQLSAGKTIGFGVVVNDWDSFGAWDGLWEPDGMPPDERGPGVSLFFYWANRFLDGLLVPASVEHNETSSVEIDSWARIKASLYGP